MPTSAPPPPGEELKNVDDQCRSSPVMRRRVISKVTTLGTRMRRTTDVGLDEFASAMGTSLNDAYGTLDHFERHHLCSCINQNFESTIDHALHVERHWLVLH